MFKNRSGYRLMTSDLLLNTVRNLFCSLERALYFRPEWYINKRHRSTPVQQQAAGHPKAESEFTQRRQSKTASTYDMNTQSSSTC